jgi:16S rRNA (guanine527-N7)-methyltransferase
MISELQLPLAKLNLHPDEHQLKQCDLFLALLTKWNKVHNLTAIRDPAEMLTKHLLDSLAVHPYITGQSIVDVGTGGGLPGIPLAILFPEKTFTLIDSNQKKISFVSHAIHTLGLENASATATRIENFAPPAPVDTVISRAFSSICDMLALTQHVISGQGQFLAMKGAVPHEELSHLPEGFAVTAVHPLQIPGLNAQRCLIVVEKK